jgi:hypothetical protein
MTVDHNTLDESEAHEIGYRQATDPGAVGAGISWIDTSGGTGAWVHKVRNAANDGWEIVGSSSDFSVWDPDAPNPSPSTYDDEFDDESVDTKWNDYDEPNSLTYSEGKVGFEFTGHSTSNYIQGIYQDVPSGEGWSIITKVSILNRQNDDARCGLLLLEDVSALSTSDLILHGVLVGAGGTGFFTKGWTAYSNQGEYNIIGDSYSDKWLTTFYLRLRAASGTWYFDWSSDGIGWIEKSTRSRDFTPEGFGLGIRGAQDTPRFLIHWFRYSTDTDRTSIVDGDRISRSRA